MTERSEPGDILRYRSRPRHKGEILCHNHVAHLEDTQNGINGFRYFVCKRGGEWQRCPCGWRPELGVHYALPDHRKRIKEGKPMTMYWPLPVPPGFKRVRRIARRSGTTVQFPRVRFTAE
jgi:hypothetical protein